MYVNIMFHSQSIHKKMNVFGIDKSADNIQQQYQQIHNFNRPQ